MTWINDDYVIEQALERKQLEQELQQMFADDNIPNWSFCDEDDQKPHESWKQFMC